MKALFELILFQPLLNIFIGFYHFVPDVGVVILLITLIVKIALYPLNKKAILAQQSLAAIQPKLEALKKEYPGKENQQQLAQATMKLYAEHKVNPVGSCLPMLIQIPIFLAMYWMLRAGLAGEQLDLLYAFVPRPEVINTFAFGIVDLAQSSYVLALMAGAAQFWQAKSLQRNAPPKNAGDGAKDESMATMMNKQMLYTMPIITILVGASLPGGLALYWFFSTFLTALQQYVMNKQMNKKETTDPIVEGKIIEK